jgi:hypothetical protein
MNSSSGGGAKRSRNIRHHAPLDRDEVKRRAKKSAMGGIVEVYSEDGHGRVNDISKTRSSSV